MLRCLSGQFSDQYRAFSEADHENQVNVLSLAKPDLKSVAGEVLPVPVSDG
ncbi:hypothetical protein AEST_03790 [Alishewanella aestuarii B11]|uniref:Uncharacterized protein n=1 Tax=Alishewanella aestuarii B11 TaxID=1197174 RepID=J1Q6N6_9ALTE|nr:hypothetical protein AEST_03790 [Alishewanella aestuarii B11]